MVSGVVHEVVMEANSEVVSWSVHKVVLWVVLSVIP